MKAISIREPWAGLILAGRKTIETRTWATKYRGDLLICVSAKPKSTISGNAACVVRLVDCRPMRSADARAACLPLYPGAWAWILEDVRPIVPFPVKGRLSLYGVAMPQESLLPADGPMPDRSTETPPLVASSNA